MERDFDTNLVKLCAPTLAGLKPASLFRLEMQDAAQFAKKFCQCRARLRARGVTIRVLKACAKTKAYLIYVYREARLNAILADADNAAYLQSCGYTAGQGCSGYLRQLSTRLCCEQAFPHEIGIFLGYPLEDVVGFVENKGRNYTHCGYWKSYGDPAKAAAVYERYRKCTEIYLHCFARGVPITRLTVAV